jgi:hypothetical protein
VQCIGKRGARGGAGVANLSYADASYSVWRRLAACESQLNEEKNNSAARSPKHKSVCDFPFVVVVVHRYQFITSHHIV